jgi:predicted GNAT superfamily acetyltransferase
MVWITWMAGSGAGSSGKHYFSGDDDPMKIRFLENPDEMTMVEELQRVVWPGSETDVVPAHLLITAAHNGGVVIGAYDSVDEAEQLVGFVFGFPGLYFTPDGPRPKHCSHMLGVHPEHRNKNIGFRLKRAQWQWVRHQGLDLITWTYDPLLSRNARLNIAKLGAVCNTYKRQVYGSMRDGLNVGLPSDRFQVDWWVNTPRVERRLSRDYRRRLDLAHCLSAGASILNPTQLNEDGWPVPPQELPDLPSDALTLVEIPPDFLALKSAASELALAWRLHTRALFEQLFAEGYLVTDFIYLSGSRPRSFYVLSHGESTF